MCFFNLLLLFPARSTWRSTRQYGVSKCQIEVRTVNAFTLALWRWRVLPNNQGAVIAARGQERARGVESHVPNSTRVALECLGAEPVVVVIEPHFDCVVVAARHEHLFDTCQIAFSNDSTVNSYIAIGVPRNRFDILRVAVQH